jgi:alcohol dehydrogenase class IV
MEAPSGQYSFTRLERVIFGPGSVSALGRELERRGCKRALVITGNTLGRSRLLDKVKQALGPIHAGIFSGARQHVPSKTVDEAASQFEREQADCLVSFGGGSPIDTAKAAAMKILSARDRAANGSAGALAHLFHMAIPTTLSAGEFTPFGGVTDESTRRKGGVGDPRLQPAVVILDPALAIETPAWLWASTGIKALDHAVEASYSTRHQLVTDTLAARAISLLNAHLLPSMQTHGADELAHRGQCQLAAWLSIFGAINSRLGISHALGHQIGARWDVPHGVTSCITVPHAMRLMARLAPARFGPIAEGFDLRFDAAAPGPAAAECAERAARFIGQFEVPTRLRDVGVPREELAQIAGAVLEEINRAQTVDRPLTESDLTALLEAAY